MLHLSHSYAVSSNPIISANGSARTNPASRLESLRHGARGLSAHAHEPQRTRARLCLDLPAALFTFVDLAPSSERLAGRAALPRHVVPLQAFQPLLASADTARLGESGVEASGGDDSLAACALPPATRRAANTSRTGAGGFGGSLRTATSRCRDPWIRVNNSPYGTSDLAVHNPDRGSSPQVQRG